MHNIFNIFIDCILHLKLLQNNDYTSLGSTTYPCCYFIHSSLYLLISHPIFPLFSFFSPLVTSNLFSVPMSIFLFCYIHAFIFFFFLESTFIDYLSFSGWLISLRIILSRSIYIVAHDRIPFYDWVVFHCMHIVTSSSSIQQLVDPLGASISWLL